MADLDDVEFMRVDRVGGEHAQTADAAGPSVAAEPSREPAEHEGSNDRREREKRPSTIDPAQTIEIEPRRNWLLRDGGIARVDQISLCSPCGHARRVLRMRGKPGFDRSTPVRRQLAVHVGVQFGLRDRRITIDHRSALTERRTLAIQIRPHLRARAKRDITVPIGSCTSATSR